MRSGAGGVRCHSTEGVAEERRGGGSRKRKRKTGGRRKRKGLPLHARLVYETLKVHFGLNRCSEGTNIFLALLAVCCHPHRVRDYVTTWQNTVTKMRGCHFNLPGYVLALLFVKNLPESMAFGSLRSHLNTHLENMTEADMGIFKEILRDVVELDAQFRSASSLVNNCTAPSLLQPRSQSSGQRPPHSSLTLSGSAALPPPPDPLTVHRPPPIAASSGPTAGFCPPGGFIGRCSDAGRSTQAFVASLDFPVAPHANMLHANTTLDGEEGDVLVVGPGTPLPTGTLRSRE